MRWQAVVILPYATKRHAARCLTVQKALTVAIQLDFCILFSTNLERRASFNVPWRRPQVHGCWRTQVALAVTLVFIFFVMHRKDVSFESHYMGLCSNGLEG